MPAVLVAFLVAIGLAFVALLIGLLPAFNPDQGFLNLLDSGIALFIDIIEGVRWFLPLNVFVICLTVILAVDNWSLISRIIMYFVKIVRG
ncbi:hypothetical protein [Macellibacteroides fermentans]|uniref:hypothetical protein n=1 Tax=Macellibacteroides fermentans TaxID=879969 RepID=UPI00406CD7A5